MSEAALRERIDYLEAEVDRLNRLIGASVSAERIAEVRRRLKISPGMARLLMVLLSGPPGKLWHRDALFHGYCGTSVDQPDIHAHQCPLVSLWPAMHATAPRMSSSRTGVAASPNQTMPITTVPSAPIPVHTA